MSLRSSRKLSLTNVWIGQQLDRRHAERLDVVDHWPCGEPAERAALGLGHGRVELREAAHVRLVDDRPVPRHAGSTTFSRAQSKFVVDDDALGHEGRAVALVEREVRRLGRRACSRRAPDPTSARPMCARAYGSSSSLFGLKRCPCSGAYGPCTR